MGAGWLGGGIGRSADRRKRYITEVVADNVYFGDSRRPYSRELKSVLEPTYAYYPFSAETALASALKSGDEKALDNIKRQAKPELALVRYSDKAERIYYSQLTRVEGRKYIPLTEIIINKTK